MEQDKDNIPGIGRTSFTIRFDAKSWMSNDIFGKDLPTQIKVVGMYRPTWWEKFKAWFGYEYPLYIAERVEPRDLTWVEKKEIEYTKVWQREFENLIQYPLTPTECYSKDGILVTRLPNSDEVLTSNNPDYGKIKFKNNQGNSSSLGDNIQATYLGKANNIGLCNMIIDVNYFQVGDRIQTEEQVIVILSKPQMWSEGSYSGWLYEIDTNINNISVGHKVVKL